MHIRDLYTRDSIFKTKIEKLKSNSYDISLISDMVSEIQSSISQLKMSNQDVADCLYITAGVIL